MRVLDGGRGLESERESVDVPQLVPASGSPPRPLFLFSFLSAFCDSQISSFSMLSLRAWIWDFSWEPSFVVTEQAMTC